MMELGEEEGFRELGWQMEWEAWASDGKPLVGGMEYCSASVAAGLLCPWCSGDGERENSRASRLIGCSRFGLGFVCSRTFKTSSGLDITMPTAPPTQPAMTSLVVSDSAIHQLDQEMYELC